MKKIGIIGGGFTGTMTAVQIIENSTEACEIIIIDKGSLNKGVAYHPYSNKHLLNVTTAKMGAYADNPQHFLDWLLEKEEFKYEDKTLISKSFLPRQLYGEYLCDIWTQAKKTAILKQINVSVIEDIVIDLDILDDSVVLWLENGTMLKLDFCVIATGNNSPGNPRIKNIDFYKSSNYFQDPWKFKSVEGVREMQSILIIGNGLSMVDTTLGLLEQGFGGEIHSISPHGFNILPHRHNGIKYLKILEELKEGMTLYELVKLTNKHIKTAREFGFSAEPIIDALRLHSQKIWQSFTDKEKAIFLSRVRHLWGAARHRVPMQIFDLIQELRINSKLNIISGKIIDISESEDSINVIFLNKKNNEIRKIQVSRVINCSGPETDLMKLDNCFLKKCLLKGILIQDDLKLGIKANTESFQIVSSNGKLQRNLYTIGASLKGELWESTSVNEIRLQAEKIAKILLT